MKRPTRYVVSIIVAYVAFVTFNHWYFLDKVDCFDCFFRYGVPFAYFHEGGFAGGSGYIWPGILGDGVLVVICGVAIATAWEWLSKIRSK